jgi:tripartite-type tricarboxylate transporter receptor subunit TctC
VGSSAGGGTDITARLIARHIERYIPGKPHFHNLCVVDSAFAFFIF